MNFAKKLLCALPALALSVPSDTGCCDSAVKTAASADVHPTTANTKRFAAYFFAWSSRKSGSIDQVDPMLLTHINFAFVHLGKNGKVYVPFGRKGNKALSQMVALKKVNPALKAIISVGGWTDSYNFSDVAASAAARRRFVKSTIALFDRYNLDGIDIDWEFPVVGGNNIKNRPEDNENFLLLLSELREAFTKHTKRTGRYYELTIAGGAEDFYINSVDLGACMKYLDYINVMTYDYHTTLTPYTGHNAPLYPHKEGDVGISVTIAKYIAKGVRPQQMNLGLPFYGRAWSNLADTTGDLIGQPASPVEKAYLFYTDIEHNYVGKNGFERYVDEISHAPYLFDGTTFISYDDTQSVSEKIDYVIENDIGGMMFWEFAGDSELTLQRLVYERLLNADDTAKRQ